MDTSRIKMDTSGAKMDTSENKMDTLSPSRNERLKPIALEKLIEDYCKTDFKSLEEIARFLKKTPKYLKNKVMPRMVESGVMERLYPNNPNHPQQKYKAKE